MGKAAAVGTFIDCAFNCKMLNTNINPESGTIILTINSSEPQKFPVYLRFPSWATSGANLSANGELIDIKEQPRSYVKINRKWKNQDEITFKIEIPLYLAPMPDNQQRAAIKYGPLVMAGQLGDGKLDPLKDIPLLITNNEPIDEWLTPAGGQFSIYNPRCVIAKRCYACSFL